MDELDYRALGFWWSLLQGIATGLTVLWVWLTNRQKVNSKAIEELRDSVSEDITNLERRLIGVEKDISNMPNHTDLAKIHDRLNESNENITRVAGELKQISRTTNLIHEHLLNGGKR